MRRVPVVERIMAMSIPEPNSGCWLWTGSTFGGYAKVAIGGGKTGYAHKILYQRSVGDIPDGYDLDHLCRVRCCVNPSHLEPVTRQVNVLRGVSPAARHAQKTHCCHGHPLSGDNLVIRENGWRRCAICRDAAVQRFVERRRLRNAA